MTELRVSAALVYRDVAAARLARSEAEGTDAIGDDAALKRAQEEEAKATLQAEAAKASAADARDHRRAEVFGGKARAQEHAAGLWEQTKAARERQEAARDQLTAEVLDLDARVELVRTRGALDPDRPDPDEVHRSVRALLDRLRRSPATRGGALNEARETVDRTEKRIAADWKAIADARRWATEEDPGSDDVLLALDAWNEALEEERRTALLLVDAAGGERELLLGALHGTREARRALHPYISNAEATTDRGFLIEDVRAELSLLAPSVATMANGRVRALLALRSRLSDFNLLRGLVLGSFWTLLLLGAWGWARRQVDRWTAFAAQQVQRRRPEMRPADLAALHDPVSRSLRAIVDLLLGWMLVDRLGELAPELGFVLLVYLQVALYRVLLAVFDLLVVPISEVRPAPLALREVEYPLARRAVQLAVGWFIVRRFAAYLLWDVLALDVVASLGSGVLALVGVGLVLWLLYVGEPVLRARIARRKSGNRPVRWLQTPDDHRPLRVLRSAGILVFFAVAFIVDLAYLLARERSSVAMLFNAVSRYILTNEADQRHLPDEGVERILTAHVPIDALVERPELAQITEALETWRRDRRRGMVALVGDRGSGKRTACDEVSSKLRRAGVKLSRVVVEGRITTEGAMVEWMARHLELGPARRPEDLVDALERLEPKAFVVEDAHFAFSRRVEGFAAISAMLFVLNATCDRHFWVVGFHQPTWEYFACVGTPLDVTVFQRVVRLAPLTVAQLRELTTRRTEAAGYSVDFSTLAHPSPLGGDPAVELERAVHLFYRLLAEASDGTPRIALRLWARCLEPAAHDPNQLRVHLNSALSTLVLSDLQELALFALVALRVHDELDETELAEVTNVPASALRGVVRNLQARGLLARAGEMLKIPDQHLPTIARTLRRRHFLYGGAA